MLEVRDVCAGYGVFPVLRGISLAVGPQECVAVIGPNGAGKTTLMRCISGLIAPTSGTVTFDGLSLERRGAHEIVAEGLVQVPEGRQLFAQMTVLENLLVGASARRSRVRRTAALEYVFELFPRLRERAQQLCGTLSGGERQMVAIGRALMASPRMLMLDEPSLGLAPRIVSALFGILRRINADGVPVLLVEQNVSLALSLASRAYVLDRGKVATEGESRTLLAGDSVAASYLSKVIH